jgi:hypothetical protein
LKKGFKKEEKKEVKKEVKKEIEVVKQSNQGKKQSVNSDELVSLRVIDEQLDKNLDNKILYGEILSKKLELLKLKSNGQLDGNKYKALL